MFVQLHHKIRHHAWLNEKAEWFMGWSHILLATNWETGHVNLTEVYRDLKHIFTNNQWRHFIKKLEQDKMLTDLETINHGSAAGYQQTATVTNYLDYHDKSARSAYRSESHSQHGAADTADDSASTTQTAREESCIHGAPHGASTERRTESNKTFLTDASKDSTTTGGEAREKISAALTDLLPTLLAERPDREAWFDLRVERIDQLIQQSQQQHRTSFRTQLKRLLDLSAGLVTFDPNAKPRAASTQQRAPWDVSGGDRQNRHRPDYKPVRGQTPPARTTPTDRADRSERDAEARANDRRRDLARQAAEAAAALAGGLGPN